jgi:hypothetical protein
MVTESTDRITVTVNGSEANRQLIVDEICEFLNELAERLSVDLNGKRWGFDMQSTRAPKLK